MHLISLSGARNAPRFPCSSLSIMVDGLGPVNYILRMIEILQTAHFSKWYLGLKDRRAAERIALRLVRLQSGLFGDVKFFDGIGELRVDYGPGYRLYFVQRGEVLVILLCGGDKSTQRRDIARALDMAKEV